MPGQLTLGKPSQSQPSWLAAQLQDADIHQDIGILQSHHFDIRSQGECHDISSPIDIGY